MDTVGHSAPHVPTTTQQVGEGAQLRAACMHACTGAAGARLAGIEEHARRLGGGCTAGLVVLQRAAQVARLLQVLRVLEVGNLGWGFESWGLRVG